MKRFLLTHSGFRKTYLRYMASDLEAGLTYTFNVYSVADAKGLVLSKVQSLQQGTSQYNLGVERTVPWSKNNECSLRTFKSF